MPGSGNFSKLCTLVHLGFAFAFVAPSVLYLIATKIKRWSGSFGGEAKETLDCFVIDQFSRKMKLLIASPAVRSKLVIDCRLDVDPAARQI